MIRCEDAMMRVKAAKCSFFVIIVFLNLLLLIYLAGTNRLATNDEARDIAAGVSHWFEGEFGLANDSPPLARMVAVIPLLKRGVPFKEGYDLEGPGDGSDVRDRELSYAGRFAGINPEPFNLIFQARMTGFLWWLLGAWVIFRWSAQLHGGAAGYLGVVLWCFVPIVLGYEQLATPELPAAVICAAATYVFRAGLVAPSWPRSLTVGILLGIAQLIEFASLTLIVIWPLAALAYLRARGSSTSRGVRSRIRTLRAACAIALSVWIINSGYGFQDSGSILGRLDFASSALKGDSHLPGERPLGNRFRGTWAGRLIVPMPEQYLKGLDRRWHELEVHPPRGGEPGWPVEVGGRSRPTFVGELPLGIWALMLGSLMIATGRHANKLLRAEELTLWLCVLIFLAMTTGAIGLLSPAVGTLLATPFAIVIASKIADRWRSSRWKVGWLAVAFSACSVGDCLRESSDRFFTLDRVTRFRQDLVRQGRKFGMTVPEPRTSVGTGPEERGLIYRTWVDSRGVGMNYALFVPEGYRGDRPYPLLLVLHGWGDRGRTAMDRKYTEVGLPFTLKYRSIDFLVLCPQGHSGFWEVGGADARRAMELLAAVQKAYRVDPNRISLTGLSTGGTGVCDLAARHPDRWAAIIPVAGMAADAGAPLIKRIPCWFFHNRYDGSVSVEGPRRMIVALRALGGNPRYTEYPDTNHNAGERAYIEPELYDWLAQQRRP
jgi:predicted esterase